MGAPEDFSYYTGCQLRELVKEKRNLVEVIDHFLGRIAAQNPKLNALLYVNEQNAKNYACKFSKFVDANDFSRPLLGVPIVVPDSLHMKGTPTTMGSLALKENICEEDQIEITLLKNAGAIILGKCNMAEFRLSALTQNLLRGPCQNPAFPGYPPGGPTAGGGAAVAAGMAPMALAVDMGGGLRVNSTFCNLVGLIPSRGRVPTVRRHLLPYSERMFYRKGILARDIRDIAMMLNVLSQPDRRDPLCVERRGEDYVEALRYRERHLKIAWCPSLDFLPVDPEVAALTSAALSTFDAMGHHVETHSLGFGHDLLQHFLNIVEVDRFLLIMNILKAHNLEPAILSEYTQEFLEHGDKVTGVQYALAITYAGWVEQVVTSLFNDYDLLVLPTCAKLPERMDGPVDHGGCTMHRNKFMELFGYTCAFNMSGHPVVSLPCGATAKGPTAGLQLVGPQFAEGQLLSVAKDFLKARKWESALCPTPDHM